MSAYAAGGTAASKNRRPSVPNSASSFSRYVAKSFIAPGSENSPW